MLRSKRLSRTARTIVGVAFGASLLTTGIVVATTNVAVGKVAPKAAATATDVVGAGTFNCASGSGEVGYSPASGSTPNAPMMISVWLEGTKCTSSTTGTTPATPLPTDVILSFSVEEPGPALPTTTCPLSGTWPGNANLAYNSKTYPFPPKDKVPHGIVVGDSILDPSVAMSAGLTTGGATWTISGPVQWGSYPSTSFTASFHPWWLNGTGVGGCAAGITSGWVDDVTLTGV